jgi:Uma2 family endonuclease
VFLDDQRDTLIDATVIVEVLSPSTQKYNRNEKFRLYRGMLSFAEYLLLAQDAIRAEHYVRKSDGSWLLFEIADPTAVIELTSIGCRLPLGALYERVQFEQKP